MTIPLSDLPPDVRRRALAGAGRSRKPREQSFSKDQAQTAAIHALAVIAELTHDQRRRVLLLALEMNKAGRQRPTRETTP